MKDPGYTCKIRRIALEQTYFPEGLKPNMINLMDEVEKLLSKAYCAGYEQAKDEQPQVWSNQAALGYVISAAEQVGMESDTITQLIRSIHRVFDTLTLSEAAVCYRQSQY